MTAPQYDNKVNYCGPFWLLSFLDKMPNFIKNPVERWFRTLPGGIDINPFCFVHDKAYDNGERRKKADLLFRDTMLFEVEKRLNCDELVYYRAKAKVYFFYYLCRIGGELSHVGK